MMLTRREVQQAVKREVEAAFKTAGNYEDQYRAIATRGELMILIGSPGEVLDAYKKAADIVVEANYPCCLDTSRQQLLILKGLGLRPAEVDTALDVLELAQQALKARESAGRARVQAM